MPLALEPNRTFPVILETDQNKPEPRPTFYFKYLSGREWKSVAELSDQLFGAASGAAAIDLIFGSLAKGLVSWENMVDPDTHDPIPFNVTELDSIITLTEAHELMEKFRNQGLEVEDKKKSESPSQCDTAASAKTAKG